MAWSLEPIADGQLAGTKGTLFTAAGPVLLGEIRLVNTSGSAVTVNLYVNRTGSSRRIIPKDTSIDIGGLFKDVGAIALANGDLIEGEASTTTVVDYVLSGVKDA